MKIVCLPGDGIGPEVAAQALRVLRELPLDAEVAELPFGGAAIDASGEPLPARTLAACREADAVLLGAVGGPQWEPGHAESGLLALRRELDVYANLRPAGDLLVVRELVGGLYFGARGVRDDGTVFDTCEYHPAQVERVARRAFELARARRGSLVSVDKANVLDTSRLWRRVVTEVARQYPDVEVRHALVDSFAIEIALQPETLDVVLTENMFGDILSDLASGLLGGLGVAASASLGDEGPGVFEPIHGSAPDIAGTGVANPTAMLRSLALLLEHAADRVELARAVRAAVDAALVRAPTRDVGGEATTVEFADEVLRSLEVAVS
ncbi:MAG TPA: 3-isopropylmalate dehydrogenase [Gaiellaceae bacterium]|nr:3-isopropylmalate dehydrogenase [Gaiellaceae bacterium]